MGKCLKDIEVNLKELSLTSLSIKISNEINRLSND